MASSRLQSVMNMFRIHFDLDDLTPEQKKQSSLRVAQVLKKVLGNDRLDEATKERAQGWVKRAAEDPRIRKMLRESSEADMEAFFQLPDQQQHDVVAGIPKPAFSRLIDCLKDMQPTLSLETMALLETRLSRPPRTFGWSDVIWLAIALMIALMIIGS
jgi:hypothetical protein